MSTVHVIQTAGHLDLQETTRIHSSVSLKRGDIIRLKAEKPVNEKPYGLAEVLVVEPQISTYYIRRVG